ncbi:hypothetical protein TWF506_006005 [Arthrobotrys conoides]|uniref:Uncharacterized protein n=1 Tax=Arthrobotrys conoides TaxID=74498 RepID=A0AAN8RYF8_9PEZI
MEGLYDRIVGVKRQNDVKDTRQSRSPSKSISKPERTQNSDRISQMLNVNIASNDRPQFN